MAATSTKRSRLGQWRRPRWKDGAFWAAVGLTAVVVAGLVLLSDRSSAAGWLRIAVLAVVAWLVLSAAIRIRVGMERGLVAGFEEVHTKADERPDGNTKAEAGARVAGRAVGNALGAWQRSRSNDKP